MTLSLFLLKVIWFALGYALHSNLSSPHTPLSGPYFARYFRNLAFGLCNGTIVAAAVWALYAAIDFLF